MADENHVRYQVISFLKTYFPKVKFIVNASGEFPRKTKSDWGKINKLKAQGVINKSMPDVFISEPIGKYHGLYIELKDETKHPLKKNGSLKAGDDLYFQNMFLNELSDVGYFCTFGVGANHSVSIVKNYLQKRIYLLDDMQIIAKHIPKPIDTSEAF